MTDPNQCPSCASILPFNEPPDINNSLAPNIYSGSFEAGPFSQSMTYIPGTGNTYYSPGWGTGNGVAIMAGYSNDPDGYASGWSGGGCYFEGVGGCIGLSPSGAGAVFGGVGVGAWGVSGGYGVNTDFWNGAYNGSPVYPPGAAIVPAGGLYYDDPHMGFQP